MLTRGTATSRRLRPVALLLVVGMLSAMWFADVALARAPVRCAAASGTTLLQTNTIRVYTAPSTQRVGEPRRTYGCTLRSTRRTVLPSAWRTVTAGSFVALSHLTDTETGDIYGAIRVYDLRSGKLTRKVAVGGFGDPRAMSSVLVSATGSLAWAEAVYAPSLAGFTNVEVHLISGTGGEVTIDSGAGIDAGSLAASARNVFWMKDGTPMVAAWT
jgi:hypothetical protein